MVKGSWEAFWWSILCNASKMRLYALEVLFITCFEEGGIFSFGHFCIGLSPNFWCRLSWESSGLGRLRGMTIAKPLTHSWHQYPVQFCCLHLKATRDPVWLSGMYICIGLASERFGVPFGFMLGICAYSYHFPCFPKSHVLGFQVMFCSPFYSMSSVSPSHHPPFPLG